MDSTFWELFGREGSHLGCALDLQLPDEPVEPCNPLGHPQRFFCLGCFEGGIQLRQPPQHCVLLLRQEPVQPRKLCPDAASGE